MSTSGDGSIGKADARIQDSWAWAIDAWWEHFSAPLTTRGGATYQLERVDRPTYRRINGETLMRTFPPEVFFDRAGLCPADTVAAQERIRSARSEVDLFNGGLLRHGETVAAMFSGRVMDPSTYKMWNTVVHPDHRGTGLYGEILRRTIAYTKALGFDTIVSEHAVCNNPVLIAKMKAGFRIVKMEIDPFTGPGIHLAYFHNPEHLAAYEYRCGMATLTDGLVASGVGAMDKLVEQVTHGAKARGRD